MSQLEQPRKTDIQSQNNLGVSSILGNLRSLLWRVYFCFNKPVFRFHFGCQSLNLYCDGARSGDTTLFTLTLPLLSGPWGLLKVLWKKTSGNHSWEDKRELIATPQKTAVFQQYKKSTYWEVHDTSKGAKKWILVVQIRKPAQSLEKILEGFHL